METEATPLLDAADSRRSRASSSWRAVVACVGVVSVGTLACARALAPGWDGFGSGFGFARALGVRARTRRDDAWRPGPGNPLLAPGPKKRGGKRAVRTFTLHTQCLDGATKRAYAEFFYTGAPEGYVVRHNYGSNSFFDAKDAVKMQRVVLPSEERAWRVTTRSVDFEYGFALRNAVTGQWKREIGRANSLLAKEPCVQKYGEYFNRVTTLERSNSIDYVYGTCNATCPDGYTESQWVDFPLTDDVPKIGDLSPGEDGLDLGEGDDARLITLRTALPLKTDGNGPSGRAMVLRDTHFAETEDVSRWIMAIIDPYPNDEMKLALLEVVKSPTDRLFVRQLDAKRYRLGHSCVRQECSVASYDVSAIWHEKTLSAFSYNFWATKLQYTIAKKGDTMAPAFTHSFPDDAFISTTNIWTMKTAGRWGMDIDVRRVVFSSGGVCNTGHVCYRMGTVERVYFMSASASEAYWIASLDGGGNSEMALLKVYTDAAGNLLAKVEAARRTTQCPNPSGDIYRTSWLRKWDKLQCTITLENRWNAGSVKGVKDTSTSSGIGVGALAYYLAPEMTASLARAFNPPE